MGFSGKEYWNGLPFPPPGNLPDPGLEPMSPALAGRFFIASTVVQNLSANAGDAGDAGSIPELGRAPGGWRRAWLPTPVFLPGEFHGQRSLVG